LTPREGTPSPRIGTERLSAGGGGAWDRHRLESEVVRLRRRVSQLEREQEQVDAFAAVVAHELMEPLVMIEVHASTLTAAPAAETADLIGRAAARLRRLAESILLDARAGEEGLSRGPVDLARALQDVIDLLGPEIAERSASVITGPMPTVPGDEAMLEGLLMNLVTNALKYGPRERASIEIAAERQGDEWLVTVADNGTPIADSERKLIFEPYKRAHGERRARGAGLGLSICRHVVERHGGRIGVRSAPAGNCFYFTLPA
jgi:signal transduction histidine kinase